ncbi:AraC family transcriptional regulator [Paenibacillus sp. NPDC058177]|uniref:AraC family transcriptional regulator n=1 Tax=Paenibacillus sp. NPDC058177 TaxID=3346369 RepID=UPI0036D9AA20
MNLPEERFLMIKRVVQPSLPFSPDQMDGVDQTTEYSLFVVLEGFGSMTQSAPDHRLLPLSPGSVWLRVPIGNEKWVIDSQQNLRIIQVDFQLLLPEDEGTETEALYKALRGKESVLKSPTINMQAIEFTNNLLKQWNRPAECDLSTLNHLLREYLELLLKKARQAREGSPNAITRTIQYMEHAYTANIRQQDLSRIANMTASHFSYAFRKQTGLRPMDYLSDIRIRHAKQHLHCNGLNVKETAQQVGFTDEYYFSRRFKQRVGISPAAYVHIKRSSMKIIALSYTGQLLALGVKPLGAPRQHLANRTVDSLKAGIADIGDFYRIDLNAIAAFSPDLIVTAQELPHLEDYRLRLKRMAPLAIIPWDNQDVFGHLRQIAGILDKDQEAEAWINRHGEHSALAKAELQPYIDFSETVSLLRIVDGHIGLWAGKEFGHVLYQTLGLKPPPAVSLLMDGNKYFTPLSLTLDKIKSYAGDHLFVSVGDDPGSQAFYGNITSQSEWQELRAVQNNAVYQVSDTIWKFYEPRAISAQLQDAVQQFRSRRSS